MKEKDFTTTILVTHSPKEVFEAIINTRDWWDNRIKGVTDKLNGIFIHQAGDVHTCKLKIIEFVPGEKVVWLVMENYFSFTADSHEWEGSKMVFDITEKKGETQLCFTQVGLTPKLECYEHCASEWTDYIQSSLFSLITNL